MRPIFPAMGESAPRTQDVRLTRSPVPTAASPVAAFARLLQSHVALAAFGERSDESRAIPGGAGLAVWLLGMLGSRGLPRQGQGQPAGPGALSSSAVEAYALQSRSAESTEKADAYRSLIEGAGRRYGVPSALVAAVMHAESGFNSNARSTAGAMGLMQLMPGTAAGLGVTDPWDPAQNTNAGARLLRDLLDNYDGDLRRAIQAYNAGRGAVDRFDGEVPYEETRRFLARVLGLYEQYQHTWVSPEVTV